VLYQSASGYHGKKSISERLARERKKDEESYLNCSIVMVSI